MIKIKSQDEIELMREAGRITRDTLKVVENSIKVGVSTKELDKIAFDYIKSQGATPSFKNYSGFPASICASVNDAIVHGIPSEDIPNMFQRFSQGTSKKRSAGTGLGLYLSRQIIESHGGKIWLESKINKGSEFSFILTNVIKVRSTLW